MGRKHGWEEEDEEEEEVQGNVGGLGLCVVLCDVSPKREIGFVCSCVRAGEAACLRERDYASLRWVINSVCPCRLLLLCASVFAYRIRVLCFASSVAYVFVSVCGVCVCVCVCV